MAENQMVAAGCSKDSRPTLTCLGFSDVKAGHWKCESPCTTFLTVTRNSIHKAKKEKLKSVVTWSK